MLRWAIREDGRSLPEIAQALRVEVDALDAWAAGDSRPTRGQVSRLAVVLQRPRALFFLPRAPVAVSLPPAFRHPPGDDRAISAAARRRIRQARRVQHAVAWALRQEPVIDMPRQHPASRGVSPEITARVVRDWLDVSDAEQAAWPHDRAAMGAWRSALESRGLLVFVVEIGRDEVRGFSAWDDHAPLIVANSSGVTPAARTFTFAHELGHLALGTEATCFEPAGEAMVGADVERWCERFAAALLMPAQAVNAFVNERRLPGRLADLDDIRAMARRFRVSARAATVRLVDLGYADSALYPQVDAAFRATPVSSPPETFRRPSRAVVRPRELGTRALRIILDALPPRDALAVLGLTVSDVRRIAAEVPGIRVP